jgi:hypothetical protein
MPKMAYILGDAQIGHGSLEICPDKLIGVKFGCVPREEVTVNSTVPSEKVPNSCCPVNRVSVPEHDDGASEMPKKKFEKLEDLICADISVGVKFEKEGETLPTWRDTDSRDGRDLRPVPPWDRKMRGLSHWRPCAGNARYEQETAFIHENEMGAKFLGFFLSLAIPDASTFGWHVRFAPGLSSPASGSSSPEPSSVARDWKWNNRPQSASWLPLQRASVSRDPLHSLLSERRLLISEQAPVSAPERSMEVALVLAEDGGPSSLSYGRPVASGRSSSGKTSVEWPQSGNCDLLLAGAMHAGDAFRALRNFHGVSCQAIYTISRLVSITY